MTSTPPPGESPQAAAGGLFQLRTIHVVLAATVAVIAVIAIVAIRFYFELFPATDVHLRNDSGEVLRDVRFIAEETVSPGRANRRGWQFATFDTLPPGESVEAPYDRRGHFLRVEFASGGVRHAWREVSYVDSDEWGPINLVVGPGPRLLLGGDRATEHPEEAR